MEAVCEKLRVQIADKIERSLAFERLLQRSAYTVIHSLRGAETKMASPVRTAAASKLPEVLARTIARRRSLNCDPAAALVGDVPGA